MTKAAEELFEHRDDEGEWDDEPAEVQVRPTTTEVVSFRLGSGDLDRLQAAARARGVSLSEFIRQALESELGGGPAAELDDIFTGVAKVILGAEFRGAHSRPSAGWRMLRRSGSDVGEVPAVIQVVPEFPPTSQNVTSSEGARRLDPPEPLPR